MATPMEGRRCRWWLGLVAGIGGWDWWLGKDHDRTDFNGAEAGAGDAGGDGGGVVDVVGFEEIEAAELFFGFSEGAVGCGGFAVAYADGFGGCGGLECVTGGDGCGVLFSEGSVFGEFGLVESFLKALLVFVDQEIG